MDPVSESGGRGRHISSGGGGGNYQQKCQYDNNDNTNWDREPRTTETKTGMIEVEGMVINKEAAGKEDHAAVVEADMIEEITTTAT